MTATDYIDTHSADLLGRLQQLVGFQTVNPPGAHYDDVTRWLADELTSIGLATRRLAISSTLLKRTLPPEQHAYPRFNVLGKWKVRGARRTLHFNAHYDVVPVSGVWKHGSPFSGAIKAGWIYGRGTSDMKGSIASLMLALEALRATRTPPRMNIEVSFTADEETDSELGAGWLVHHAPISPDYAIVMEGGEGNAVCCGHNGTLWLEVTVHGKAAHGSLPSHGINALEKMAGLVLAFEPYKKRLAKRAWRAPDGKVMRPTVNLGGVFDCGPGAKINTVPAHATFTIDRRVLPVENHGAAERELRTFLTEAAAAIPDCRISIKKVSENFSCYSAPTHPFFVAAADCVSRVRGERTVFNSSTGFNDMHFFSHVLKIPTLGYGPGGENFHAVDERASIRELIRAAKIYAELMTNFAG
jgi:succinyl-diaminopimelate desuccinylase